MLPGGVSSMCSRTALLVVCRDLHRATACALTDSNRAHQRRYRDASSICRESRAAAEAARGQGGVARDLARPPIESDVTAPTTGARITTR